jgi:hypothetical protein
MPAPLTMLRVSGWPEIAKTVSWVTRSFAFASRASTRGDARLGFALDRSLCDSLCYNNHTLLVKGSGSTLC